MRSLNYLINTCMLIAAPMIISEKVETTHILTNERVNITQQSKQVNHSNTHNKSLDLALYYYSLEREWQPTPVFLPGEFHRERRLAVYSPWICKELDMTE